MTFEIINGADLTGIENRGRVKGSTNASSKRRDEAAERGATYIAERGMKSKEAARIVIAQFNLNITERYMARLIRECNVRNTST